MGDFGRIGRILLVLINSILALLGLKFIILGFTLRFTEVIYKPVLNVGFKLLQRVLEDTNLNSFVVNNVDVGQVMTGMATGLILGGLALFSVALFGCCGATYKIKCMLWGYAIVLAVCVTGEAIAIGLLYREPDIIKDNLKESLKNYAGLGSPGVFSLAWNVVMIQFRCCGVDSYEDFDHTSSSLWNTVNMGGTTYSLDTPIACCKTLPRTTTLNDCAVSPFTRSLSNYDRGCYQTLWDYYLGNNDIVVPVLVICGIIQLSFIVFAIVLARSGNSRKRQ